MNWAWHHLENQSAAHPNVIRSAASFVFRFDTLLS
jgi:hypothetical protein